MTVDRLRELLAEATPGPWIHRPEHPSRVLVSSDATGRSQDLIVAETHLVAPDYTTSPDAALIVAAVNSLPALLAVYDAAEGMLDSGWVAPAEDGCDCEYCKVYRALAAAVQQVEEVR